MKKLKLLLIGLLLSSPGISSEEPISITITVGASNASFDFHGRVESVISKEDEDAFQITNENLKRGVEASIGSWPDSVSLGDWTHMYRERKWSEVKRILYPIKAKVVSIRSEPVIVSVQTFSNQFSHKASYKAGISSEIKNSITSSWFDSRSLTQSNEISYGISFKVPGSNGSELSAGISESIGISFTTNWGVTSFEERSTTVGSSSEVSVELDPGQEAVAVLTATKGSMEVQIDYVAGLKGDVAVKFSYPYRGRYYWRADINTVLSSIDMPIHIFSRQKLKIGYYSEAKVTLTDKHSNKKLYEGPAVVKS